MYNQLSKNLPTVLLSELGSLDKTFFLKLSTDQNFFENVIRVACTRRSFFKTLIAGMISAGMVNISSSCGRGGRSFFVEMPFRFNSVEIPRGLALCTLEPFKENLVDYTDLRCPNCAVPIRIFLFALDIASSATLFTCPTCSVGTKILLAGASILVSKLMDYGMKKGIAFAAREGFLMEKVAPTYIGRQLLETNRTSLCYDIENHEPLMTFSRNIPAVPKQIFYFSEAIGMPHSSYIYHCWYKNGMQTDKIRLDITSNRFRTFSRKKNLYHGEWIVLTRAPNDDVLDVREFSIA